MEKKKSTIPLVPFIFFDSYLCKNRNFVGSSYLHLARLKANYQLKSIIYIKKNISLHEINNMSATNKDNKLSSTSLGENEMMYGKSHFMLALAGIGLILLGMFLMSGGHMPDSNTWDDSIIYSFRRVTLAPIVILAGLILEIYVIFKK